MGRYFTKNSLECGEIPNNDGFQRLIDAIINTTKAHPGFIAGTFFGSMAKGANGREKKFNPRSDIDVLLLHNLDQRALRDALREVHAMAARSFIPLSIIPISFQDKEMKRHDVGVGLEQHLASCLEQYPPFLGSRDDLSGISNGIHDLYHGTLDYALHKLGRFRRMLHLHPQMDEDEEARYFTKLIEAPTHVARRMFVAMKLLSGHDDKARVWRVFNDATLFPRELYRFFAAVISLDRQYTWFIEDTRAHGIDIAQFNQFQREFKFLRYGVINFLELMIKSFMEHRARN